MTTAPQTSTHWLDKLAQGIFSWQEKQQIQKLHVDDMKTPSGRVHTGALRGVMLHDAIARVLAEKTDQKIVSTYVFNDMDSMDGLPAYLDPAEYTQHMGKPLYKIPAPALEKSGVDFSHASEEEKAEFRAAKSFAEFYALDFLKAFRTLGCTQEIVWSHEVYESGKMDETIRLALDHVTDIRKIYEEVAEYKLPKKWYPFQVFCPQCGKVGTTLVTDWDGEMVTFDCLPDKVKWAVGCGYHGKVSPFGGTGKFLWKVDWPAHWKVLGVTIEGAGKDHTSAGGSRDMADSLCPSVFKIPVPFDVPYEWILLRGAKMSSSKGVGTSAREFVELFPPEVGRFLFVNKFYNQVIDFDPHTETIPDLYDTYDLAAQVYWKLKDDDQRLSRSFELAQIPMQGKDGKAGKIVVPSVHFLPRFRDVATWMQYPEIDLVEKFTEVKGSPLTEQESNVLEQRKHYAQIWISRFAPEEFRLSMSEEVPAEAGTLSPEQKVYLQEVEKLLASRSAQKSWDPQELQQQLFELAKSSLGARKGFEAIYLAFIGKKAGPRAAWFLLSIDAKKRKERIQKVISEKTQEHTVTSNENTDPRISPEVRQKFPGIFFAQVKVSNVSITKTNPELEELKKKIFEKRKSLTVSEIQQIPAIKIYREIIRATGIDIHKKRPSPEALLRRISQGKELYTINTGVDSYNVSVIETGIARGGFDADLITMPVMLRFSQEGEALLLLGDEKPTITFAGELLYSDTKRPIGIDLNYRDIEETKITENTKNIWLFADGGPGLSEEEVVAALRQSAEYTQKFCGGEIGEIEVIK